MKLGEVIFLLLVLATIQGQIRILEANNLGVNYETSGDNLPSPTEVVALLKKYKIDIVRLFDPNPVVLNALKGSGINVILGIKNEDLQKYWPEETCKAWLDTYVKPYMKDINFSAICVGNEVIPGKLTSFVVSAIDNLQDAIFEHDYGNIKVSTAVSVSVLSTFNPPSASEFKKEVTNDMIFLLKSLASDRAPLFINAYPYYAYVANPINIRLGYAQFTARGPVMKDGNLSYHNLLDAIVDSFYFAMDKANYNGIYVDPAECVVIESGWPYEGNGDNTTLELAQTYNQNFRKRILSNVGTPKKPDTPLKGFIYSMFDNNKKLKGVEQHFGMFYPNGTPIYTVF